MGKHLVLIMALFSFGSVFAQSDSAKKESETDYYDYGKRMYNTYMNCSSCPQNDSRPAPSSSSPYQFKENTHVKPDTLKERKRMLP